MKTIETGIEINASAERVWEILMDHGSYPHWNPFIKQIRGNAGEGGKLEVTIQPQDQKPMVFNPTVLKCETNREFRWLGHLFIKGLFDGEHYFILEPIDSHSTRFIHGERFSGLLVGMLLKIMGENTTAGFRAMNEALKKKAELTEKEKPTISDRNPK